MICWRDSADEGSTVAEGILEEGEDSMTNEWSPAEGDLYVR